VTAKESKYRPDGSLEVNDRSLRNYPVQANSAEVFRLACCMVTEQGINLCAPLHDAILIESDESCIDDAVAAAQTAMADASDIVLDGFRLNSKPKIVRYPDRYMDEDRGQVMWDTVMRLVNERASSTLCRMHTPRAA
jgi:DNA polymerase I